MTDRAVWAVVPVKPFHLAKQRLSPVMSMDERASLAKAMLGDVLLLLQRMRRLLAGVIVVTADLEAASLARRAGAEVIPEPAAEGMNEAVNRAVRYLVTVPGAALLVVPSDVPHMAALTIAKAVTVLATAPGVVLVQAGLDGGTNLLGCSPASAIHPRFGPDSFRGHYEAAHRAGLTPVVLDDLLGAQDLDRPSDVERFLSLESDTHTQALLTHLGMGHRHA